MKTTQFSVEDLFGNILTEQYISPEQISELHILLAKLM